MSKCSLCKRSITDAARSCVSHYDCEVQLNDSWRADVAAMTAQRDELLAALKEYVDWFGAAHVKGCPADDTCWCSASAINDAVNKAIAKAEATP